MSQNVYHALRGGVVMSKSSFHSTEFDAGVDNPIDIVITPIHDPHDPQQSVIILHITEEGILMDFYEDGELTHTLGRTYQEWHDLAQ